MLHHDYVGTEHLLLGLAAEGGAAATVLKEYGVTLEQLRSALMTITPPGQTVVSSVRFTPRAERVLGLAQAEAKLLGARKANSLRILLGLIQEGNGIAVGLLSKSMRVDLEELSKAILAMQPGAD